MGLVFRNSRGATKLPLTVFKKLEKKKAEIGASTGHVAPVTAIFRAAHVTVHNNFNGQSRFSSVTVTEVADVLDIRTGYDSSNKLNTKNAIDALPDDVGFIGENRDRKLSEEWFQVYFAIFHRATTSGQTHKSAWNRFYLSGPIPINPTRAFCRRHSTD